MGCLHHLPPSSGYAGATSESEPVVGIFRCSMMPSVLGFSKFSLSHPSHPTLIAPSAYLELVMLPASPSYSFTVLILQAALNLRPYAGRNHLVGESG
jgi:hypothetical protein